MGSAIAADLPPGSTPLLPEEQEALIPSIQTRGQLNEFEAANIDAATLWALQRGRRKAQQEILTVRGLLSLHHRMFDQTWKWAGQIRQTNKNIGVPKEQVREQLQALCDDVSYQIDHDTYPLDELAVRFHHRLVFIHPFPNGNGRHGRLATDILVSRLGRPLLSWGGGSLDSEGPSRSEYIDALKAADRGDISRLLTYVRSEAHRSPKPAPKTRR